MEINDKSNKPKCYLCNYEAVGVFKNQWICGKCLLKFEQKINEERRKYLDIIEQEIKNEI